MLQSNTADLEKPLTKEESYVQRRQLFKDIWETALIVNAKEDIMNKPKVIKTLRMDEIDRCPVGQSKKQRIKNLRHVCRRILDFCDRQDAADYYLGGANDAKGAPTPAWRGKKLKHKQKKKLKNVNSAVSNINADDMVNVARVTMSAERNLLSPNASSKSIINKPKAPKKKLLKHKIRVSKKVDYPKEVATMKRKIKKKRTLKKKTNTANPSRKAPYM